MSERQDDRVKAGVDDSLLSRVAPVLAIVWLCLFWVIFFSSILPNNSHAEQTLTRLTVIELLPEIYGQLLAPEPVPGAPSGVKYLGQRIGIAALGLFIVAAGYSIGRLFLRALGLLVQLDRPTRLALSGGAGLSLVSLFTLGCGLAGLLSRPLFAGAFSAAMVSELLLVRRDLQRKNDAIALRGVFPDAGNGQASCPSWIRNASLAVSLPFLVCMLLGAMLPETDFDVKEYHLEGPKEYFLDGRVHFLPHNVYTSFPFLTEMLALAGMVLRGDWYWGALVGKTVLMSYAPLTAVGVYGVGRRVGSPAAGWLGAAVYLTTPWTYRISIIAYTEGALCCYVVLTLLAFLVWQEQRQGSLTPAPPGGNSANWIRKQGALLLLVGVLAGSAVSTKYPGMVLVTIPFAVAVGTMVVTNPGHRLRSLAAAGFFYGTGVLMAVGPWMLKNMAETGNPVYPLLYSVFDGRDWNDELNSKWKRAHRPPERLLANWQGELDGLAVRNDWQSPLLFGLAPLALLQRRRRSLWGVALYALVILAAWFFLTHRIDRFWVPVNPVMSILAGSGLASILSVGESQVSPDASAKSRKHSTRRVLHFDLGPLLRRGLVLALVAFAIFYNFGFITTGLCGYNAYLVDYAAARRLTRTPSIAYIDSLHLPENSKVLFVGEAQVFDADFAYAYNTVFDQNLFEEWTATRIGQEEWELLPVEQIRLNLRNHGITHLCLNWDEIQRYRETYGFTSYVTPERIQQLVELGVLSPVAPFHSRYSCYQVNQEAAGSR